MRQCAEDDNIRRTRQELVDGSLHLNDPTKSQPQWISSKRWGQFGWQTTPKNWPTDGEVPSKAVSILPQHGVIHADFRDLPCI